MKLHIIVEILNLSDELGLFIPSYETTYPFGNKGCLETWGHPGIITF